MEAPGETQAPNAAAAEEPTPQVEEPQVPGPVRQLQLDATNYAEARAAQARANKTVKDAQAAHRRLMRDHRSLEQSLATPAGESMGLSAYPVDGDLFRWHALIAGPDGSAWEGGLFKLELFFTDSYPLEPPRVRFATKVFHPNVYVDGNICLDTLKTCWSPTLDVEALLLSIRSLLTDPNPHSAANGEAARMLVENKALYTERVRQLAELSLDQSFSNLGDSSDTES